ncbi:MAG: hypothetical protein M1825_001012 [Sarcosagium campestre]|nr:MAG: hypothetical protein M1825_001012 [Sarcosagium campestre]
MSSARISQLSPRRLLSSLKISDSQVLQSLFFILLSFVFSALDTTILFYSYALQILVSHNHDRRRIRASPRFVPRVILVTGVGTSRGLALARTFYLAGHDVVGADFEPSRIPVNGRMSRSLKKFYSLALLRGGHGAAAYAEELLEIVRREKVHLWVSCSGVSFTIEDAIAKEVIERRTECKAIQLSVKLTNMLQTQPLFIKHASKLDLNVPDLHLVSSRSTVHKILHNSDRTRYTMRSVSRENVPLQVTVLPRSTMSETYQHVAGIDISAKNPWILQQYIPGVKYSTYAVVVHDEVKAFVAYPSLHSQVHLEMLPSDAALSKAMLEFTTEFVARTAQNMTGHLSFEFLVGEKVTALGKSVEKTLNLMECKPEADPGLLLFRGNELALAAAYLSALEPVTYRMTNGNVGLPKALAVPKQSMSIYWHANDLVSLLLHPALRVLTGAQSLGSLARGLVQFLQHILFWRDGSYVYWDPLPWWWSYHVQWPGKFLASIWEGKGWSEIDVGNSTIITKEN